METVLLDFISIYFLLCEKYCQIFSSTFSD